MPPYLQNNGQETPASSVYPGLNAFAIGYRAGPGGPPSLANDQYEAVATGYVSKAIAIASPGNRGYTQRQINWRVNYGTAPSAVQWILQGSVDDVDGDYVQVDTSSTIGNFTQIVASNLRFFRLLAQAVTGACTVAAKISAM